eukprot:scaffold3147_cov110-Isochrysis_galbana.AAC.1
MPDEFFAGRGDEPVGGIDLTLLAVAFEHLEARASASLVEVGEADPIGDGLVLPVGDREFDWDFREGEDDAFTVLGLELLRAIGGRKDGPRAFLAVV